MPSPPLDKLYGKILKEIGGFDSFMKPNDFQNAIKVKNWLVHRVKNVDLTSRDADNYIFLVGTTIFQMLSHLYPSSQLIKEYHFPSKIDPTPKYRSIKLNTGSRI